MDDDIIIGIFLVVAIITLFCAALYSINVVIINGYGGPATDNTYEVCSGKNKEVYTIVGAPVNACVIKDCNQQYDGITYCDKRVFIVCGSAFCKRAGEDYVWVRMI